MNFEKFCGWASILGLVFTIASYFSKAYPIHIGILALAALMFLIISIISFRKSHKAIHYLEGESVIRNLHKTILSDVSALKQETSLKAILADLIGYCTQISDAFEKIKHNQIGTCIKYVNGDISNLSNLYITTLCRDVHSRNARRDFDKSKIKDRLLGNSDFKRIFELVNDNKPYNELYYCENRLATKHQYTNTHLNTELTSSFWGYFKRSKLWPLPYQSTIVVPILTPDGKISAFLCIDSPKAKGFNKEQDVPIVQEIALFLTDLISHVCIKHLS